MSYWKKKGAAELGFSSFTELSKKSGVGSGTLSQIYRGLRPVSLENSKQLISAVQDRNFQKGWSYRKSAAEFAEIMNFTRYRYAHEQGIEAAKVRAITDSEVNSWFQYYSQRIISKRVDPSERFKIARLVDNTEGTLIELLRAMRSWKMKHDFDLSDWVQQSFNENRFILVPTVYSAMQNESCYDLVRDIYTECLYTAHLCGAQEFVKNVSEWLAEQAALRGDVITNAKAKLTLAWILSNKKTRRDLECAQQYLGEVWFTATETDFLKHVPESDIDIVAMLAEAYLRMPIRLYEVGLAPLHEINFENRTKKSNWLLDNARLFPSLSRRLQQRYRIPIRYQRGIYFYRIGRYDQSLVSFRSLLEPVETIGWIRLEQAVYTWMGTLYKTLNDEHKLNEVMSKINVEYLTKRQKIKEELSS